MLSHDPNSGRARIRMVMRWHEYGKPCGDRQFGLGSAAIGHTRRIGARQLCACRALYRVQITLFCADMVGRS